MLLQLDWPIIKKKIGKFLQGRKIVKKGFLG